MVHQESDLSDGAIRRNFLTTDFTDTIRIKGAGMGFGILSRPAGPVTSVVQNFGGPRRSYQPQRFCPQRTDNSDLICVICGQFPSRLVGPVPLAATQLHMHSALFSLRSDYPIFLVMSASNFTMSAAKLRMPSAVFSVAMASSFIA